MDISREWVVITGGTRGIGWSFAEICAKQNAKLVIVGRTQIDADQIDHLKRQGANEVQSWVSDLTLQSEVDAVIAQLNKLSPAVLFNNAGLLTGGLLEQQTSEEITKVNFLNLTVPMLLSRAVLASMLEKQRGTIINNASVTGVMNFPAATTYAASKSGLIAFSRSLQNELRSTSVSVLLLFTPGVKTQMFDEIDQKYGAHLKMPLSSISPEEYAERIWQAVQSGKDELRPEGRTGFALQFAQHFPGFFGKLVSKQFQR